VVRKGLYLREDQDRLLKERARKLGVSEAQLVRIALDRFLSGEEGGSHRQSEGFP